MLDSSTPTASGAAVAGQQASGFESGFSSANKRQCHLLCLCVVTNHCVVFAVCWCQCTLWVPFGWIPSALVVSNSWIPLIHHPAATQMTSSMPRHLFPPSLSSFDHRMPEFVSLPPNSVGFTLPPTHLLHTPPPTKWQGL